VSGADEGRRDSGSTPPPEAGAAGEELNFVMRARREKLDALVARGVEPFAYSYDPTHSTHDAISLFESQPAPDDDDAGPRVKVAGRLVSWRSQGKTAFAHLADSAGRVQLYFRRDRLGDDAR
jgi:lysyl-tRNA synthetase class 2